MPSIDVHSKWHEFGNDNNALGAQLPPEGVGLVPGTTRMWVMRWRRRCNVKIGHMRIEEPVALDEKKEKAEQTAFGNTVKH